MFHPTATSLELNGHLTQVEQGYQFSPNFVSWCTNCESPFRYFEASSCGFIYQNQAQEVMPSSPEADQLIIVGFYCPDCEEALDQAQPTFSTAEETIQDEEETGLAEDWCYPSDEELEDAVDWSCERV